MYEKIKRFYELGLWTGAMVRQAAEKGIITHEEYNKITNENSSQ